jgi:Ubiquitinol-cytochrome C reductase Fe-S subunit TAT signal
MNQACIYMRKVGEAVKDGWQPIAAEAQNLRMAQVAQSSREATMTNDSKSPVSITGRSDREEPDVSRRDFFQHAVGGAAAVGTGAVSVTSMSGPVQAQYGGHLAVCTPRKESGDESAQSGHRSCPTRRATTGRPQRQLKPRSIGAFLLPAH